jgi:hypothetical protein
VLNARTVLLPAPKVSVCMGRFNLEMLGTQEIDVRYDPAMNPDLWTSDDPPRDYFQSSATAPELTSFGFRDRSRTMSAFTAIAVARLNPLSGWRKDLQRPCHAFSTLMKELPFEFCIW